MSFSEVGCSFVYQKQIDIMTAWEERGAPFPGTLGRPCGEVLWPYVRNILPGRAERVKWQVITLGLTSECVHPDLLLLIFLKSWMCIERHLDKYLFYTLNLLTVFPKHSYDVKQPQNTKNGGKYITVTHKIFFDCRGTKNTYFELQS